MSFKRPPSMPRPFISVFLALTFIGGSYRAMADPEPPVAWAQAQHVFSGTLLKVIEGPTGMSLPPVRSYTLRYKINEVLRGDLQVGDELSFGYSVRQMDPPAFSLAEDYLVACALKRKQLIVNGYEKLNPERIRSVRLLVQLPLGWTTKKGDVLSPWAALPKVQKQAAIDAKALHCSVSGRPALLNPAGLTLSTRKVPPVKEIQWTNPDGDGLYTVRLTNSGSKELSVPGLLCRGETLLWEESLLVLCQKKAYTLPRATGNWAHSKPLVLQPGESVETVVNVLQLMGPEWPRGGYRIEFQFCLGSLSRTESFYYMSRHHDGIREKALEALKD